MSNTALLKNKSSNAERRAARQALNLRRMIEMKFGAEAVQELKRLAKEFTLALEFRAMEIALSLPQDSRNDRFRDHQKTFRLFVTHLCNRNPQRDADLSDIEILQDALSRAAADFATRQGQSRAAETSRKPQPHRV